MLITITLLAFLVLLLVSLASLTRVETQVSANSQSLAQARQNAITALNIALGHLQTAAGPDQRFTARADIVSSDRPYITGVWKADGTLVTWLTSGNTATTPSASPDTTNAPDPAAPTAGDNEVFLVGNGSVSTASERVKLRRQPFEVSSSVVPGLGTGGSPVSVGHYAYWIGDEGVKASVGLSDTSAKLTYNNKRPSGAPTSNAPADGVDWTSSDDITNDLRNRTKQLAQPHVRSGKFFPDFDPDSSANRLSLPRALTRNQLAFADSVTPAALKEHFHDLTVSAGAILVDHTATNGRLRQDLSDTPEFSATLKGLQEYLRERPISVSANGLQATHNQDVSDFNKVVADPQTPFPIYRQSPVLTEAVVHLQFFTDTTGALSVRFQYQGELWNPYSCTLNAVMGNTTAAAANNNSIALGLYFPVLPVVDVTMDGETLSVDLAKSIGTVGLPRIHHSITWAPGEIITVRGAGGSPATLYRTDGTGAGAPSLRSVRAKNVSGTNLAFATAPTATSKLQISVPADATVTAKLFKNNGGSDNGEVGLYTKVYDADTVEKPSAPTDSSGFVIGFAFDFNPELKAWVDGTWDEGLRGTARDPRFTPMTGNFIDPDYPVWSSLASANTGSINLAGMPLSAGGDPFHQGNKIVLFEFPRQEPYSIGTLQHLVGTKPYQLGNPTVAPLPSVNDYFDRYFISTLPRYHLATIASSWKPAWDPLSPPAFPNRYIRLWIPDRASPPTMGDPMQGSTAPNPVSDHLMDLKYAASHLMLRGAFNINSTSKHAWRAVLGGIKDSSWTYGGASPSTEPINNAFFRLSHSAQELTTAAGTAPTFVNSFFRGARSLSDTDIETLADSVAQQIAGRGKPFTSLRDFVDSGILQTAIDNSGVNPGSIVRGSPGWLSQADLLTSIAPFITPRSDTFVIRAYGDASNPVTGQTTGKAWCEAVVQRVPDLTSPASGTAATSDILSIDPVKYPFGRKFMILSFQWLSSADI